MEQHSIFVVVLQPAMDVPLFISVPPFVHFIGHWMRVLGSGSERVRNGPRLIRSRSSRPSMHSTPPCAISWGPPTRCVGGVCFF